MSVLLSGLTSKLTAALSALTLLTTLSLLSSLTLLALLTLLTALSLLALALLTLPLLSSLSLLALLALLTATGLLLALLSLLTLLPLLSLLALLTASFHGFEALAHAFGGAQGFAQFIFGTPLAHGPLGIPDARGELFQVPSQVFFDGGRRRPHPLLFEPSSLPHFIRHPLFLNRAGGFAELLRRLALVGGHSAGRLAELLFHVPQAFEQLPLILERLIQRLLPGRIVARTPPLGHAANVLGNLLLLAGELFGAFLEAVHGLLVLLIALPGERLSRFAEPVGGARAFRTRLVPGTGLAFGRGLSLGRGLAVGLLHVPRGLRDHLPRLADLRIVHLPGELFQLPR